MKQSKYDFAIIGGDMRQVYLAGELASCKNRVCCYALMAQPDFTCSSTAHVTAATSLEEACKNSSCIVCPIPLSKNGCDVSQNFSDKSLPLDMLLSSLHSGQHLFAGCIPEPFCQRAKEKEIHIFDLMKDNALAVYNTIATAEGAICEAISRSPQNLHQSHCAVLGYGKCGRTLTQYLNGMFCHVHVYTNVTEERAIAGLVAEETGTLADFHDNAQNYSYIFNTIPAMAVPAQTLAHIQPMATIIDIASAPGGIDYQEAEKAGITAALCPGLPGKYAPKDSAKGIKKSIEMFLSKEKEEKPTQPKEGKHCL